MACFSDLVLIAALNLTGQLKSELHETNFTIKNNGYEKDIIGYYNSGSNGGL
jgi:hypothetical protein